MYTYTYSTRGKSSGHFECKHISFRDIDLEIWNTHVHVHTHIYTCYIVIYIIIQHHNDTIIKQTQGQRRKKEGRRRKTSLQLYLPLTLFVRFERVVQGLHVRG